MSEKTRMTQAEWAAEGVKRFGPDKMNWKFKCPVCQVQTTVQEYFDSGAESGHVGFSCIGRFKDTYRDKVNPSSQPCNYAGGGLFKLNPITVVFDDGEEIDYFEFGDAILT